MQRVHRAPSTTVHEWATARDETDMSATCTRAWLPCLLVVERLIQTINVTTTWHDQSTRPTIRRSASCNKAKPHEIDRERARRILRSTDLSRRQTSSTNHLASYGLAETSMGTAASSLPSSLLLPEKMIP